MDGGTVPDPYDQWLTELRARADVRGRTRTTWLQRQADEEATLVGVLTDLAERARPVLLEVSTGRRHRAVITLVGGDFCALRSSQGVDVLVAHRAISVVRPLPGEHAATGDRGVSPLATLGDAVASLAGDRRRVSVWCGGTEPVTGELDAVGRDLLRLRPDAGDGWAYVGLASVAEVSVLESG